MNLLRRFGANTPIAWRMTLATTLLVVTAMTLAASVIGAQWQRANQMGHLHALTNFTTQISDLVHELQKERGMSAVFLNSKGTQLASTLPDQRRLTDDRLSMVKQSAERLPMNAYAAEVRDAIGAGLAATTDLDVRRTDVSAQRIAGPDSNRFYTGLIARLLSVPREAVKSSVNPVLTTGLLAYDSYLAMKERAGLERATAAAGFTSGQFTALQHRAFLGAVAEQLVYLDAFNAYATPAQRDFMRQTVTGPAVREAERMRDVAINAGVGATTTGVSGMDWFKTATARIDLMKQVEDRLADDLARHATQEEAAAWDTITLTIVWIAGALIGSALLGIWLARGIVTPIVAVSHVMDALGRGDLATPVPTDERKDEIGTMLRTVRRYRDSLVEATRMREENESNQKRLEAEKQAALTGMADRVETETNLAVEQLGARTTTMTATATEMRGLAYRAGDAAQGAARAATAALDNAQTVASAAEELAASIREISGQVNHSTDVVNKAVEAGTQTRSTIEALNERVARIGDVADIIGDIAARTNLLALNATIEAARAGEAGKGFAVVASEVKQLANQTARSTEEIARHIGEVRAATAAAVSAVARIETTIGEVNSISASIAAAVEQQGAATAEIARNVAETAAAVNDMGARNTEVAREAEQAGRYADEVSENTRSVDAVATELQRAIVRAVRTFASEVDRRTHERHPLSMACHIDVAGQTGIPARLIDLSEGGARLADVPAIPDGTAGFLRIEGLPTALRVRAVGMDRDDLRLAFEIDAATREQIRSMLPLPKVQKAA